MTNEEKAKQIELNVYAFGEKPKGEFQAPAYRASLKMAEWKDQQFKEYLEKRKALYEGKVSATPAAIVAELNEIINELFGE